MSSARQPGRSCSRSSSSARQCMCGALIVMFQPICCGASSYARGAPALWQ